MKPQVSPHDLELLSAYLDRQLAPQEHARLEERLQADPILNAVMAEMRRTRAMLRKTPRLRAPRRFTLTPDMVAASSARRPQPARRAYPVLGVVSALASLTFVLVLLGDLLGIVAPANGPLVAGQSVPPTQIALLKGAVPETSITAGAITTSTMAESFSVTETLYLTATMPTPTNVVTMLTPTPSEMPSIAAISPETYPPSGGDDTYRVVTIVPTETATLTPLPLPTETPLLTGTPFPAETAAPNAFVPPFVPAPGPLLQASPEPVGINTARPGLPLIRLAEVSLAIIALASGIVAIVMRLRAGR